MAGRLERIALDQIRANPVALRDVSRESEAFQELVESVKSLGVQQSILVQEKPGDDGKRYELIDGLQRFTASQEAGLLDIPAHIVEKSEADALIAQVVGNAVRVETKPVEYARALLRILSHNPTWTESELAAKLSKSPSWISKQLGLLKLHDKIKPLVDGGEIPVANAAVMAKLPQDEQLDWLERAQNTPNQEFAPAVLARVKEIRDANRRGEDAGAEQFTAVGHFRKKPEVEEILRDDSAISTIVRDLDIAGQADSIQAAAELGFKVGLQYVLHLDPRSVEAARLKWEQKKKDREEAKKRREAERAEKRAREAQARAEEARRAAELEETTA